MALYENQDHYVLLSQLSDGVTNFRAGPPAARRVEELYTDIDIGFATPAERARVDALLRVFV